jgi:hypothetical protein
MKYADREAMIEAVYAKTDLDMDLIDAMTNEQLQDILELNRKPANPEPAIVAPVISQPAPPKAIKKAPRIVATEYVDCEGVLCVLRTYSDGTQSTVRAAERVAFNGRIVSAGIVLHWVQTGELVNRLPTEKRVRYQAAIRHGGRVIHLGRFNSKEAADAAKQDAKFKLSMGLPIG